MVQGFQHRYRKNPWVGERYGLTLDKLGGEDVPLGWWLLGKLCQMGWEPFSAHGYGERDVETIYYLRKSLAQLARQ